VLSIPVAEFVPLAALLTCLTALSIDIMLPVLPQIGRELGLTHANDQQWVVTSYLSGMAFGQIFVGTASDRFGRLPILYGGLVLFIIGAGVASQATSFQWLLIARALQGLGGAAPRIIVMAVVRDLYSGRRMARIMSLVMTTFIMVPVFAPSLGQLMSFAGGWRTPIFFLASAGIVALIWAWLRLPETSPRFRELVAGEKPAHPPVGFVEALASVRRSRQTVGYVMANGFMLACLMSYILSSQQVFVDIYKAGVWFPVLFGAIAVAMAIAGLVNAWIVVRLGTRSVAHRALIAFLIVAGSVALMSVAYDGRPPFWALLAGLWTQFFFFGLIVPNFNALAIGPLGHVAGTASSVMGTYTTLSGAVFGTLVGQHFNGTTLPLGFGFVSFACAALIIVLITERGRLFHQDEAA
jgi:DHA1 family bicyclomycin/chloramphenicol resistance-like MFS transporter